MATRDELQRNNLPIPDRPRSGPITYDAKDPDTRFSPIRDVRPPQGSPNAVVILIDDVGYGAASVFGGMGRLSENSVVSIKYRSFAVTVDKDAQDADHYISPDERLRIAMARQ